MLCLLHVHTHVACPLTSKDTLPNAGLVRPEKREWRKGLVRPEKQRIKKWPKGVMLRCGYILGLVIQVGR